MRQSELFAKTDKSAPADADSKNAQLLVRAGFVRKESAGVWTFLPLGLRVLRKIERIVREGMLGLGFQEVLMAEMIARDNLLRTGRQDVDVAFWPTKSLALGFSHEELATPLAKQFAKSWRDLPLRIFHIQTKFRHEKRAKSGLLRGREFLMKDGYSFHSSQEDLEKFYSQVAKKYLEIFSSCGLQAFQIQAGGGIFSEKISHEFQVQCETGEDVMLCCNSCDWAANSEIFQKEKCPQCSAKLKRKNCIEVGNIFDLGDKFSRDFDFKIQNENGENFHPRMACFGIGISRLVGTIAEICNDERGLIWPKSVAPFDVHLIDLSGDSRAEQIFKQLQSLGLQVLFDDRSISAGKKFADADLVGIPLRLTFSKKTLERNAVEIKNRAGGDNLKMVEIDKLSALLAQQSFS